VISTRFSLQRLTLAEELGLARTSCMKPWIKAAAGHSCPLMGKSDADALTLAWWKGHGEQALDRCRRINNLECDCAYGRAEKEDEDDDEEEEEIHRRSSACSQQPTCLAVAGDGSHVIGGEITRDAGQRGGTRRQARAAADGAAQRDILPAQYGLMDSALHVIKRTLNPRFLS
jgi:hypothetical protein